MHSVSKRKRLSVTKPSVLAGKGRVRKIHTQALEELFLLAAVVFALSCLSRPSTSYSRRHHSTCSAFPSFLSTRVDV